MSARLIWSLQNSTNEYTADITTGIKAFCSECRQQSGCVRITVCGACVHFCLNCAQKIWADILRGSRG